MTITTQRKVLVSKFYWKTTSREQLLSSSHSSRVWEQGAWKGPGGSYLTSILLAVAGFFGLRLPTDAAFIQAFKIMALFVGILYKFLEPVERSTHCTVP